MRALKILIKSLTLTCLVAACAPGSHDSTPAPAPAPAPDSVTVPTEEANSISAQTALLCKGTCPPAIAMSIASLQVDTKTQLYRCTAFLVSPDVIVTNAHCVPQELHQAGTSCAGRMTFYFGSPNETVTCDKVLSISQDSKSNLRPDYAFLRLGRTVKREPLKLSRQGAADNEPFIVYSVDPATVNGQHVGAFKSRPCTTIQNSMLTPQFVTDQANVMTTACAMNLGNSGSPMIARDGTVRGILHGIRTAPITQYKGYKLPPAFDQLAFATNFACADGPTLEGPQSAACSAPFVMRADRIAQMMNEAHPDLQKPFEEWRRSESPTIFKYAFEQIESNKRQASIARFNCIDNPDTWLNKAPKDLRLDGIAQTATTVTLTLTIPLWGLQPALDSVEHLSVAVDVLDRAKTTMTFNLADARKNKFAHMTKSFTSETGLLVSKTSTLDIPFCN